MNCQRAREILPELLDSRTAATAHLEVRSHLAQCPACQREFAALSQTVAALDALPVAPPSPQLRQRFYAMLEDEKHALSRGTATAAQTRMHRTPWFAWILGPVAGCALVAAGFFAGRSVSAASAATAPLAAETETRREIHELRAKLERLETMNQLVAASFQQQQQRPANDRLRTVLNSAADENPTDRVINELIASLALDASANVRLRALDALYAHADRDVVRAGVLASLTRETNPLVQVQMIDFLAAARDHEAKPALEKMSINEQTDGVVRQAAKRALAQL